MTRNGLSRSDSDFGHYVDGRALSAPDSSKLGAHPKSRPAQTEKISSGIFSLCDSLGKPAIWIKTGLKRFFHARLGSLQSISVE